MRTEKAVGDQAQAPNSGRRESGTKAAFWGLPLRIAFLLAGRAVQPSLIGPLRPRYEGDESCLTIANARSPSLIANAIATATAGFIPKEARTTNSPAASAAAVT